MVHPQNRILTEGFCKCVKVWMYAHDVLQSEMIRLHNNMYKKHNFGRKNALCALERTHRNNI